MIVYFFSIYMLFLCSVLCIADNKLGVLSVTKNKTDRGSVPVNILTVSNVEDVSTLSTIEVQIDDMQTTMIFKATPLLHATRKNYFHGETISNNELATLNIISEKKANGILKLTGSLNYGDLVFSIRTDDIGTVTASNVLYSTLETGLETFRKNNIARKTVVDDGKENRINLVKGLRANFESNEKVNSLTKPQKKIVDVTKSGITNVVSVMVFYTHNAMCEAAGKWKTCLFKDHSDEISDVIDLAIEETNTAFELSNINAALDLVRIHYVGNLQYYDDENYSSREHLNNLGQGKNGLESVDSYRERYGADLVVMITASGEYCGLGFVGPSFDSSFSVVRQQCAASQYTFAHEIGHNLGCNHDRDNTNGITTGFAFGYQDPKQWFRSILAYDCEDYYCARVQRFSSPNLSWDNRPLGDEEHNNVRQINSVVEEVASYYRGHKITLIVKFGDNPENLSIQVTSKDGKIKYASFPQGYFQPGEKNFNTVVLVDCGKGYRVEIKDPTSTGLSKDSEKFPNFTLQDGVTNQGKILGRTYPQTWRTSTEKSFQRWAPRFKKTKRKIGRNCSVNEHCISNKCRFGTCKWAPKLKEP